MASKKHWIRLISSVVIVTIVTITGSRTIHAQDGSASTCLHLIGIDRTNHDVNSIIDLNGKTRLRLSPITWRNLIKTSDNGDYNAYIQYTRTNGQVTQQIVIETVKTGSVAELSTDWLIVSDHDILWSPDGQWLALMTMVHSLNEEEVIVVAHADGSSPQMVKPDSDGVTTTVGWSSDSSYIAKQYNQHSIALVHVPEMRYTIINSDRLLSNVVWAPTGHRLAYQTMDYNAQTNTTSNALLTISDPDNDTKTTFAVSGDEHFSWSPDSKSLLFIRQSDRALIALQPEPQHEDVLVAGDVKDILYIPTTRVYLIAQGQGHKLSVSQLEFNDGRVALLPIWPDVEDFDYFNWYHQQLYIFSGGEKNIDVLDLKTHQHYRAFSNLPQPGYVGGKDFFLMAGWHDTQGQLLADIYVIPEKKTYHISSNKTAPANELLPYIIWSPDHQRAVFEGYNHSYRELQMVFTDGTVSRILYSGASLSPDEHIKDTRWSPDGSKVMIVVSPDSPQTVVRVFNTSGTLLSKIDDFQNIDFAEWTQC